MPISEEERAYLAKQVASAKETCASVSWLRSSVELLKKRYERAGRAS